LMNFAFTFNTGTDKISTLKLNEKKQKYDYIWNRDLHVCILDKNIRGNRMESKPKTNRFYFEIRPDPTGTVTVLFHGRLLIDNATDCLRELSAVFQKKPPKRVVVDIGQLDQMDDYGALVIFEFRRMLRLVDRNFEIINHERHLKMLQLMNMDFDELCPIVSREESNRIIRAGEAAIQVLTSIRFFIAFIGSTALSCLYVLKRPSGLRYNDTISHMKTTGVDALPIVGLINLLLGLILAFMSSLQLRQYGADLYVATLVTTAMVSELGPIMTAIVVAGRSGSAYAAEISTMKISEEIDALFVMGFDPNRFLVLPRMFAALIVLPLLSAFAIIFSIAGGTIIGTFAMNLTPQTYISQSLDAITMVDVVWGLVKSAVFAILIAITGCLRGFQARGGAASVGNAATSAVVTSIFLIILFDSIFAIIRSWSY